MAEQSLPATSDNIQNHLSQSFPKADINVRTFGSSGSLKYYIEASGVEENELFVERKRPSVQEEKSKKLEELKAIDKAILDNWEVVDWRYSDEENFEDLRLRAQKAFDFLENRSEDTIVVVTHKNFLHCLMWYRLFGHNVTAQEAQVVRNNLVMSNTGIVWMQFDEDKKDWKIITWNDHAHLG
jgi:broad specificity phosphatase PhoE